VGLGFRPRLRAGDLTPVSPNALKETIGNGTTPHMATESSVGPDSTSGTSLKSKPPLTRQNLRGTWGTLLLPIREDESIDYAALEEEIDFMIRAGVAGIYSNGSAGEFYAQSPAEFIEINTRLARACQAAGTWFQIGASHPFAQETLERIRSTKHLAPDAYQIILPDWFIVRGEEVGAYLERIIEAAAPAGIVLYNPPHAKRQLPIEEIGRLARRFPGLLGIKVAGGDDTWYRAMREHCGDLSVFIPGHLLVTGLVNGAHGTYSNVACLHPTAAVRWNEMALSDPDRALIIQQEILAFLEQHIIPYIKAEYVNAAADKLLAAIGNWSRVGTRLRWPYRWIPEDDVASLRKAAHAGLAKFFALADSPAPASQRSPR
jgi:4-hydroxy-tetrahydrodipicolinate synthase